MKGLTLATVLLAITTLAGQTAARIKWNREYSPSGGWRGIHHRSQKKGRILARRRN